MNVISTEIEADIRSLRDRIRISEGRGGQCGFVADAIMQRFGWEFVSGTYLAPSGEPIGDHSWNLMPDGSILDATADQFCEGHDIRIIPANDPEINRYRLEWSEDYNPSLVEAYPELANVPWSGELDCDASERIRKERGDGWWLRNPSDLVQWTPQNGYNRSSSATSRSP